MEGHKELWVIRNNHRLREGEAGLATIFDKPWGEYCGHMCFACKAFGSS